MSAPYVSNETLDALRDIPTQTAIDAMYKMGWPMTFVADALPLTPGQQMVGRVSRAETNQAVWRSKSVPLGLRCSAKMSACDGCRREPLVAARLVESRRQGNRRLSAWWRLACSA